MPTRVEPNTDRLLDIFARAGITGTFFVLGWVAARHPAIVKKIRAAGHEIASHGYWHQLTYDLPPEKFREDVRRALESSIDVAELARNPRHQIIG